MDSTPSRGHARPAILREALHLFASHGVDAVSLRDIAAATGYSNPALFRHFPGKEALAEALFAQCYGSLLAAIEAGEDLNLWLEAALEEINRRPEGVLFVLDNLRRYWATLPDGLKAKNLPKTTIALIQKWQASGRVRADIEPRLLATVLFGALGQVARSAHFRETRIDPQSLSRALAEMMERGVAPAPAEPSR